MITVEVGMQHRHRTRHAHARRQPVFRHLTDLSAQFHYVYQKALSLVLASTPSVPPCRARFRPRCNTAPPAGRSDAATAAWPRGAARRHARLR